MIYAIFMCTAVTGHLAQCSIAAPRYYQSAAQCEHDMIYQYGRPPAGSTVRFDDHRIYWRDSNSRNVVWYQCEGKPTWSRVR